MHTYKYPHFAVTVDNVIFNISNFNDIKVLLITRKNDPYKGFYALPGGFLDPEDDDTECAAIRELREETNIDIDFLEEVCVLSGKDRDPRERVISIVYSGIIEDSCNNKIKAGDDAATAQWISIKDISEEDLAFDHWKAIIYAADKEFNEEENDVLYNKMIRQLFFGDDLTDEK